MKTKHIIIGLIILVGILFFIQKKEHAGSVPPPTTPTTPSIPNLSNEAIQNIAKIYADTNNEAVFNNIKVTGNTNLKTLSVSDNSTVNNLNVNGNSSVTGNSVITGTLDVSGKTIFKNQVNFKGAGIDMQTHFPYSDGKNYIRGTTQVDGNLNITDAYNLTSRVLPGTVVEANGNNYTWPNFGNIAKSYFKRSDPDGTFKIISFYDKPGNRVWILGYIKIGIQILMFQLQEHGSFISSEETSRDGNWRFVIPK
jgi:hypothetical protein